MPYYTFYREMKFLNPSVLSLVTVLVVGTCGNALAQSEQWGGTCEVTFYGSSTLHDFSGKVKAEPFTVSISDLQDTAKAKASSKVTVKASKMVTGNKKRDAKMYISLATKTYPNIVVEISDLTLPATKPAGDGPVPQPTIIPFTLNLKGKKQQIIGKVSDWSYSDGSISYTISFPVSLKSSGIDVPPVLGLVKVADEIRVKAKLKLKRK